MPDDLDELPLEELPSGERGTAHLLSSALHAPPPAGEAEAKSRREVEQLMQDAALSPKVLREAVREQPRRSWWRKLLGK